MDAHQHTKMEGGGETTAAPDAAPQAATAAAPSAAAASPPSPCSRPPLLILYGSQTGYAQEAAERIAREARCQHFASVRCMQADQFDRRRLPAQPLVLFVCSTTGQGEVPDNCKQLYRFLLRRDLPSDSLVAMRFGVFGLGDSSYPLFNAVARRLQARLVELGARPLLERGLGDDQAPQGSDEALDPWLTQLWAKVEQLWPLPEGIVVDDWRRSGPPPPKFRVEIVRAETDGTTRDGLAAAAAPAATASSAAPATAHSDHPLGAYPAPPLPPFLPQIPALTYTPLPLRLLRNERLTPADHFQDVRHIEFEIPTLAQQQQLGWPRSQSQARPAASAASPNEPRSCAAEAAAAAGVFAYEPGDVLLVHPRSMIDEATRQWIERTFNVDYERDHCTIALAGQPTQPQRFAASSNGAASDDTDAPDAAETCEYPSRCSIRDLFELHLDVLGTPRRYFFEQLSHHATTEMERERLQELCNPAFQPDLNRYATREKRTYLEALGDFPHSVPPSLAHLVDMVPRLQPRQFSIASALEAHPNRIQLLLAVFTLVTPFKRVRTGVCSSWLASLQPSRECFVPCWIKRGTFHPPADRQRPVLMVGPGTGIAPFRAMAEARAVQKLELEARTYELEPVAVAESAPAGDSNGSTSPSEPEPAPVSPLPHAYRPFLILFGNRNRAADFFYRDQWESFDRDEHAVHFHAVFSRDAADETGDASDDRMRYVQHVLERVHSASVARMLLAEEGCVMVAGSATGSMPKDVRAALGRVLQRHGPDGNGWSEQQAEEFLKAMDRKRRYLVEAW